MAALTVAELTAVLKLRDEATAKAREIERNVSSSLERLGSSLTSIGTRLSAAVTLPIVGLAVGTAKAASDYERQITKLVTLSGLTEAQMKAVRTSIESIGPATGKGPKELADAMLVVTSTGLRGAEAIQVLSRAAELSAVGLGETAGVARALTSSITAYGKETVSASRASDVLIATVREGGAEATEMAGAFGRVVGIAQQAGVSLEEVGAQVATFTRLGISADEAVTALRGTILGLLAPTDETKEALASLGTSADQVRASIKDRGLADTLIDLVKASKGNVEVLSQLIPNVRAMAGVLGTAGSQAEAYKETLDKIQTSSQGVGDTQRALERASKDSGFQFDQLVAKVQALAVQMGEKLLPAFEKLEPLFLRAVDFVADLVEAFGKLPTWVQESALVLAGLAATAGPIALVTGQIVGLITQIKILQGLSLGATLAGAGAGAAGAGAARGLLSAVGAAAVPVLIVGMVAAVVSALLGGTRSGVGAAGVSEGHPGIFGGVPVVPSSGPNAFTQAVIRAGQGGTGPLALPAGALAGIFGAASGGAKPAGAGLFGGAKPISEEEIKRLAKGAEDFQRSIEKANEDAAEFFRAFQQSGHLDWIRNVRGEWERSSDAITRATNSETARILAGLPLAPIGRTGFDAIDTSTPQARAALAARFTTIQQGTSAAGPPGLFSGFGSQQFGQEISRAILGAIQGGGNIGNALAGSVGSQLFGNLAGKLTSGLATTGLQGLLGSTLNSILPGIGALIGPLAGKLFSKIGGIFTGGEEARLVNPARDKFFSQFGSAGTGEGSGFLTVAQRLTAAGEGEGGGAAFRALLNAGTMAEFEAAVDRVTSALERAQDATGDLASQARTDFDEMAALAQEYGIRLESLGSAFAADRIAGQAAAIASAFARLRDGGADVGGVLFDMRDEIGAVVEDALRFGVALPESFRELVEEVSRANQLFDRSGQAITDLSALAFEAFDTIGSAAEDAASRGERAFANADFIIRPRVDDSDLGVDIPGFASGSGGVRNFGRGTLAVLHGEEAVLTKAQLASMSSGRGSSSRPTVIHTHVHLDRRQIGEAFIEIGSDGI